jgi:hypothetical protein
MSCIITRGISFTILFCWFTIGLLYCCFVTLVCRQILNYLILLITHRNWASNYIFRNMCSICGWLGPSSLYQSCFCRLLQTLNFLLRLRKLNSCFRFSFYRVCLFFKVLIEIMFCIKIVSWLSKLFLTWVTCWISFRTLV